jgi:NDP-sugar pyrophosphorylase family protein
LVIGWKGEMIRDHFGNKFANRDILYVEQKEMLGTGHALSICRNFLRGRFLVLMGDDIYDKKDLEKCLKHDLGLLVVESEKPYAAVEIGEDGSLKAILESPHNSSSKLVNIGVYCLDEDFFNYSLAKIPSGEYGLPQTIVEMAKNRKIYIEKAGFWLKVNIEDDLRKAREHFEETKLKTNF